MKIKEVLLFIKCMILTTLMFVASSTSRAMCPNDGDNLYVFTKPSTIPAVYSLEDLDKITFSETGINFWNTKWPTEFAYSVFRLITFDPSHDPNSIEQIVGYSAAVMITYDPQQETVYVTSEKPLSGVIVYDLQGRPITIDHSLASYYELSLLSVPRGIYIVKVNGSPVSKKIVK